jgi:glycosyltransferase involved in cell wall biosynthesis
MRICFFTENYYKGGLDTFFVSLINSWPDSKDELTLACNESHPGLVTIVEKTRRPLNIERYSRFFTSPLAQGHESMKLGRSFPVRTLFVLAFKFLQYPILFPWYIFTLANYFRKSDFDRLMVVNGGYPASLLCRCAVIAWSVSGKRPMAVMNFHSLASRPIWYFKLFEDIIDALVIRFSDCLVSVSEVCLNSLTVRSAFLGCTKLTCIHNGIEDPVDIFKNSSDSFVNKKSRLQNCLMLATYHSYKGHYFLLEAFKNVLEYFPGVQLKIYGHGTAFEKQQVAAEVKRLMIEGNVTLGDFTTQTAELFADASVLVVPSQAYESFGLTIIEAMAFGVPVVATDVGGIPEVMANTNSGYVCPKDDPLEFSIAIMKILRNQNLASELGRNGRQAFERKFTARTMAISYRKLLE